MPRWALASLLVVFLAGCERQPEAPERTIALAPVDCAELHADGSCEVSAERALTIVLPSASGTPLSVSWRTTDGDDAPLALANTRKTSAGTLIRLTPPAGRGTLLVGTDWGRARLEVAPLANPAALVEARALRAEGKLEQAQARVAPLFAHADPVVRARARGLLARLRLSAGRIEEALVELRAAILAAEAAGLRTTAAIDRIALGDTLRRRRFALGEARQVLRAVDPDVLDQAAWASFQLGVLAMVSGNARAALATFESSEERGRALGLDALAVASAEQSAEVLSALGRHEEALAKFATIRAEVASEPCERAGHLSNLGWNQLSAALHGAAPLEVSASLEAAKLFEGACADPWSRDNAWLNVALAKAFGGAPEEALAILERTRDSAAPGFEVEAFRQELEAQLLRDSGKPAEALSAYDRMAARAGDAAPIAFRYRVALGRALSLRALDRPNDAVSALLEAEAALDQQERLVPLGDERGSFLGFHQAASIELVDLLLELGNHDQALEAVRRGRSRLLRSLARWSRLSVLDAAAQSRWEGALGAFRAARERADAHAARAWTVAADERAAYLAEGDALANSVDRALDQALAQIGERSEALPVPVLAAGEALFTAHPVRGGWAAFLAFDGRVEVARFAALRTGDDAALSADLLAPFTATLERARSLRVLSGGELDKVAVHALPFGAGPLLAALPVVYALDLPDSREAQRPLAAGDVALLVVDPRLDLPLAQREAGPAAAALGAHAALKRLAGREATLPTLLAQLPGARWFHFAGHAELSRRGMLESALSLASRGSLQLSDVLALPRVPEAVVLSACEGALAFQASRDPGAFASLGLAQGFVLAGSRAVVATTAAVPDRVAEAMSTALYAAPFEGTLGAPEFRRAALALRERFPAEWWYYRLVVP